MIKTEEKNNGSEVGSVLTSLFEIKRIPHDFQFPPRVVLVKDTTSGCHACAAGRTPPRRPHKNKFLGARLTGQSFFALGYS